MDVRLFQTLDGGEIELKNGQLVTSDGLAEAAYLSMFGGNESDGGLKADNPQQWWGNVEERNPDRRYRSETQNLIRTLPATSSNLRRLEDAAKRDLAWFMLEIADSLDVVATIPRLNWVDLFVGLVIGGKPVGMTFAENWKMRHP